MARAVGQYDVIYGTGHVTAAHGETAAFPQLSGYRRYISGCSRLTAHQPCLSVRKGRPLIKLPVRSSTPEQMDSAGSTRAHAVEREQKTARYVAEICLGPATVVQKDGLLPTEDPLKLTLIYPVKGLTHEHAGISLWSLLCSTQWHSYFLPPALRICARNKQSRIPHCHALSASQLTRHTVGYITISLSWSTAA